jgi:hypothetical protein
MPVFRREHIAEFQKVSTRQFVTTMADHLRTKFPAECGSQTAERLRQFVSSGMERATSYKVLAEGDVRRYLERMVIHGPDFDTNRRTHWAGQVLRTVRLNGTEKMDAIERLVTQMEGRK